MFIWNLWFITFHCERNVIWNPVISTRNVETIVNKEDRRSSSVSDLAQDLELHNESHRIQSDSMATEVEWFLGV